MRNNNCFCPWGSEDSCDFVTTISGEEGSSSTVFVVLSSGLAGVLVLTDTGLVAAAPDSKYELVTGDEETISFPVKSSKLMVVKAPFALFIEIPPLPEELVLLVGTNLKSTPLKVRVMALLFMASLLWMLADGICDCCTAADMVVIKEILVEFSIK